MRTGQARRAARAACAQASLPWRCASPSRRHHPALHPPPTPSSLLLQLQDCAHPAPLVALRVCHGLHPGGIRRGAAAGRAAWGGCSGGRLRVNSEKSSDDHFILDSLAKTNFWLRGALLTTPPRSNSTCPRPAAQGPGAGWAPARALRRRRRPAPPPPRPRAPAPPARCRTPQRPRARALPPRRA